jgi:hypothetical protein
MRKMNKNTSIILIAAVAGIMIAGTLAVTLPTAAFALAAPNGGIGKLGEPGGTGTNGGTTIDGRNSQLANGGSANGGNGGDANGGAACNEKCGANS